MVLVWLPEGTFSEYKIFGDGYGVLKENGFFLLDTR